MHHLLQSVLFFLAILATLAVTVADANAGNADILYYSAPACNDNIDWMYCSNVPDGYCCQSQSPFCARVSCESCSGKSLTVFQDTLSCPGLAQADATCTSGPAVNCCVDAGSKPTCAGSHCK